MLCCGAQYITLSHEIFVFLVLHKKLRHQRHKVVHEPAVLHQMTHLKRLLQGLVQDRLRLPLLPLHLVARRQKYDAS